MKKYQVTKKQCQKQIDANNNVCDHCGRKLHPIKTVNNADEPTYWVGCFHRNKPLKDDWGVFTSGVRKEIYRLAYKIILEDTLYLSMDKDINSDFNYQFQNGVSKICGILKTIECIRINKPRKTKVQLREEFNNMKRYSKTH